ncbi:hypothetical protein [Haloarcula salinisoli]|uniref:Uncharacterized protein n=1 Tax=Haloarcula salinisoli TaxID=2487746 RepID=A0A8J7YJD2_9EURY|nr:hypothetical protein [Halomicroarcula salinisoli]MBX0286208.1 hypothetical protein [Halomicroarcula salinisoli]MBX0302303.1 hypothetical protein [Halomicroarcula salinisoli]
MAVTDGLRTRLERVAPATSARIGESRFLLAGATAGLVGWGGTQMLLWLDPPASALLATALWAVLVGGFVSLTVLHGPDAVRFSDPMFGWGVVNGTAMALTVGGLVDVVPARLAFWTAWVGAATLGYLWTGGLLVRAGAGRRGWGYLAAGAVALAVLALGTVAFDAVAPVAFLLLATLHAIPLVLDAKTTLSAVARGGTVSLVVCGLLAVGLVV